MSGEDIVILLVSDLDRLLPRTVMKASYQCFFFPSRDKEGEGLVVKQASVEGCG